MSPFEIFRRNLKPAMVVLTALALFSFVVLPAMDTYLRRGGSGIADPEVAVFDGKPVKASRVEYLTRNHQSAVRFLRELAEETIRRGGIPRTPGFVYDTQTRQIRSIGIDERPSQLATIRTLQFAAEATKAGFELDDPAIKTWLNQYVDDRLTDAEISGMLMQSTRNQMGPYHLYEQLRNQLLAELYQRGALAGVIEGQFPIMTPAEQWTNFLKVNQKATVDTYAVLVNDYIDQTNESPSEVEIERVYQEGIKRFPNDLSPDPGFRKRETATFEYLVADMKAFTDREIEQISEEELKKEYERRLKGGDFQLPDFELPDLKDTSDKAGEDGKEDSDSDEKADAGDAAAADIADSNEKEMNKGDDAKAESEDNASESSEDDADKNRRQLESFKEELDAIRNETADAKPDADDQSFRLDRGAVRLVALQQDESTDKPADDSAKSGKEASEKGDTKLAEKTDADAKDKNPAGDAEDQQAADKTTGSDDEKPDHKKPAEETSEKPSDEPAKVGDESADDKPANDKKPAEDDKPKVETFEDVRDQIAESLARLPAQKKIDAAVTEVTDVMRRYFNEKAIYDSNVQIGKEGKEPTRPDLAALAKKLGMKHQVLPPHDVVSIAIEPISRSAEVGTQIGRRGPSFPTMMFGMETQQSFIPKQQLYSPLRTADDVSGQVYVSWKIDEQEGYLPDLEEVRADVITAIRKAEARELALSAAEKLADKINAGKAMEDVIPEDKKDNWKEGLGPFSWMTSFGFQGAFPSSVPQLDAVGDDFMRTVFSTEVGKAGVATNDPERVVYVVKPTGFQPHVDDLKQIFKQPQERFMALPLGSNDARAILTGFYESVDERTGFTYAEEDQQ